MNPILPIALYASAYLLLFATWALVVFFQVPGADQLVQYIQVTLGALTGHVLTLIDPRRPAPDAQTPVAPPGNPQSGRALPGVLLILAIAVLALLAGCSSLQFAGNASYSVQPFVVDAKTGATVCCQVDIKDGKERSALDLHVVRNRDNYDITLSERGVLAFQGQQIAAGATQAAIDAAAKAAAAAALAPLLPVLIPAAGAVISSGATGAVVGGAALGLGTERMLVPSTQLTQPKP